MRSEPICAYIYINGEIIQSSSANAVFRGDKTKIVTLESNNDAVRHNHRNTVINYKGGKNNKNKQSSNKNGQSSNTRVFSPCPYCKKNNHPHNKCWWRPDIKCHKFGQLGHVERICKTQQQQGKAKAAEDQPMEEQLFVASFFATNTTTESWLIDSGCTNHMTYDCYKHFQLLVIDYQRLNLNLK